MNYWILKTEPSTFSFEDLKKSKKTTWDGVRNYQARNNLRQMKKGDIALIYHSGDDKKIVGISEVITEAYQDPTTKEDWSVVDLRYVKPLSKSIELSDLKSDKILREMILVRQSRLSVSPLTSQQYNQILKLTETR